MWKVLFNVKSEVDVIYLSFPWFPHSPMHPLRVSHNDVFLFLLCILFPFQEHSDDKQYPQKCQDPLLSHLQPLSPGQAHLELRRYYSICQDTAFGPPGFQEGEGELKKEGRTVQNHYVGVGFRAEWVCVSTLGLIQSFQPAAFQRLLLCSSWEGGTSHFFLSSLLPAQGT